MTTRVVGTSLLSSTSCALRGVLLDVAFAGGSCPATLPHVTFEWSKAVTALSGGEQTQVNGARTMLQGKLDAEESCADLRAVNYFQLTLDAGGAVQSVTAWLNGPTVGGKQRQLWARWSKQRSAFSGGEQSQLDAVATLLGGYLTSEEPL
jgi:hypothetical protein